MAASLISKHLFAGQRLLSSSIAVKPRFLSSFSNKRAVHSWFGGSSLDRLASRTGLVRAVLSDKTVGGRFAFSTVSMSTNDPVVSVEWLHSKLKEPGVKVLDASWYMPNEKRNPIQEYQVAHIPGALLFDLDGIADRTINLPHMLPSEEAFGAAVSALGIENKDGVVVYDGKGLFSAARVWWMFRVFGHDRVWVLDGGLPKWRASGYDVESSASSDAILKASAATEAIEKVYQGQSVGPIKFQTKFQPDLVWTLDQV
ncbi:Thiosulfate/3-mercaptopyruvate sulfurtransferase 1, mitochondrial-like protein, partial [Drosera capensis]